MQIGKLGNALRKRLHILLVLPHRGNRRELRWFIFGWFWSIAGVVPGVTLAAFVIGRWGISGQLQQEAISITLATASVLLTQIMIAGMGMLVTAIASFCMRQLVSPHTDREKVLLLVCLAPCLAIAASLFVLGVIAPFFIALGAVRWYFTLPAALANVAAGGSLGALLVKSAVPLWKVVLYPALKNKLVGTFSRRFRDWLLGADSEPRGV